MSRPWRGAGDTSIEGHLNASSETKRRRMSAAAISEVLTNTTSNSKLSGEVEVSLQPGREPTFSLHRAKGELWWRKASLKVLSEIAPRLETETDEDRLEESTVVTSATMVSLPPPYASLKCPRNRKSREKRQKGEEPPRSKGADG
ncbi:hypothetical protein CRG98_039110 [Punica granatum]|uniref:Uncharacterized protein n=1 Tax=Punica granatum TaxID=22663 RepID=A0A2I0I8Z0_PUNGR|nr:hypothetical protein CRG98_039110 [Punica granatum]